MALIRCPECGKEISDRSVQCINCGFPLSEMRRVPRRITEEDDYEEEDSWDKETDDDNQKSTKTEMETKSSAPAILILIGIGCMIFGGLASSGGLCVLGFIFLTAGIVVAKNGQGSSSASAELRCPCCKSSNISVSMAYTEKIKGYSGELRKKSPITRAGNRIGRATMIMATGGLWALTPKKSKYRTKGKVKSKTISHKDAICQNCGFSWKL